MKIVDRFFSSFESSVESLRLNKVLLSNLKKEILEKSKEQVSLQKTYKENREYFSKNQMGKPIIEKMDEKFKTQQNSFVEFSKSAQKKQTQLKNQSHKIYKSNPSLRVLQEYEDFIPAEKFTSILVNLVKGHQEGLVDSQKLIDIRSYKRIDLEKGSVFVKDNRTHYSDVILINEENEVLFLVRNRLDDFQPKKYCFPGGHVEKGEDYKYAGVRELVEETGVNLSQDDVVDVGTYTDNKIVIHYFTAKVKKEELNIFLDEREHESYEWVPMNKVHEYPLILNLKENLEKVISIPVEFFINSEAQVRNFYYISGDFLKEEDTLLAKSLGTIYTAFRVGEISQEQYEKQLKKSCREVEPFNLYKSNGETYYGVRISDKLEKALSHKYYFREGTPGNYKYYYTRDEYFQAKGKDYVESKPKQDIVGQIESKLEDKINEIIKATEDAEFARTGFYITDFDKELLRLSLLQDMFSSIGKYIEETDELIDFKVNQSLKGNFTIQMSIKRDGQPRYLETDVIYAGGYNIQKLHLRYITNTDLVPKSTPLTNKYKEKSDKLTKLQRLEKDVKYYESVVERYKKEIAERQVMSDEDKALAGGGYGIMKNVTWEELVERGADKNYNYSEQEFISKREKSREENIERFNQYTKYIKDSLKSAEKDLAKRIQRVEDFNKTDNIEKSEKIKGGLADGETVEELAAHHKTSIKKIYDEIEVGKKVEMEHTDDPEEALEITMDHLWEIPDYYTRLAKMEKEAKEDELKKGKDVGKLIKKKVLVTRKNRTFLSTVYVSADSLVSELSDMASTYDAYEPDSPSYVTRVSLPAAIVPGESYEFSTAKGTYKGSVKSFLYDKSLDTIFILLQTPEGKIINIGVKGIRDLKPLVDIPKIDLGGGEIPPEVLKDKKFEDISIVSSLGGSSDVKLGELDFKDTKFKFAIKGERESLGERDRREHLRTGALTDSIYALMGQDFLPSSFMEDHRGKLHKLTKFMEGAKELGSFDEKEKKEYYKKLQKGFVLDCLLSNWDVIGINEDNVLVTPDKKVIRIDNDGSLDFRAKGRKKNPYEFLESKTVDEISSLRDPVRNPSTAKVYKGITDAEIRKQVEDIIKNRGVILSVVDSYKGLLSEATAIRTALVHRMKDLEERFLKDKPEILASKTRTPREGMPSLVTEDYFDNGWDELVFEGNEGIKEQIKKRILEVEEDHKDVYEREAKNRGISVEEFKRSLQDLVEKFTEKSKPFIALHGEDVLPLVFSKDGRFKSQFEVGTSCGSLDSRSRSYNESIYFDFPDNALKDKELRPIYGYSTPDENGINYYNSSGAPDPTIRQYGDVYCEIKREKALKSATITFGDSLNRSNYFTATPFAKPHFTSLGYGKYLTKFLDNLPGLDLETYKSLIGADGHNYEELQYHNQLTLDDVKTINVTKSTMKNGLKGMNKAVNKLLEFASGTGRFIPLKIF